MAQGGGFGLRRNDALPHGKRLSAGPDRRHPGLSRRRSGHHRGPGRSGNETVFTYGLTGDRLFDAITISSAGTLVAGTESRGRQRDRHVTEAHYLGLHRSQFFHRDTENISGIVVYGESRVTASPNFNGYALKRFSVGNDAHGLPDARKPLNGGVATQVHTVPMPRPRSTQLQLSHALIDARDIWYGLLANLLQRATQLGFLE